MPARLPPLRVQTQSSTRERQRTAQKTNLPPGTAPRVCLQPLMIDLKRLLVRVYERSAMLFASSLMPESSPAWNYGSAPLPTESPEQCFECSERFGTEQLGYSLSRLPIRSQKRRLARPALIEVFSFCLCPFVCLCSALPALLVVQRVIAPS